eukprot:gene17795-24170_t
MENQHIWGRQVQEAVLHLKTHRHKFVSLFNRCAKESDEASRSQSKPTPDLTAKQSELELDVFGHVMECNAAVWKGVQRDEFLLQNLEVNPLQLPEGVQRGTVSRNAVLVEATRSNDIRILKFKLCKMEKNLTGMLLTRGRGKDICQCVSVCLLATEVHNGGAKLREELDAFVQSNADALLLMNALKAEVLRLTNMFEVAKAASAAKDSPDAADVPKTFVDVMQVWYRLLEHMPIEGRCPCVNADDATFCARKPDLKSAPITINGVKYYLCASYETHAMYKHPHKYTKEKAIAINKAMSKKKDKEACARIYTGDEHHDCCCFCRDV